jgi:RAB protein geranylgeranyltransferase component A
MHQMQVLNKRDESKFKALEMECWRQILRRQTSAYKEHPIKFTQNTDVLRVCIRDESLKQGSHVRIKCKTGLLQKDNHLADLGKD